MDTHGICLICKSIILMLEDFTWQYDHLYSPPEACAFSSSFQISYWLVENGFTVLIAACDTFRAGAVEQLRTHQRRLNSLHPPEKHGGQPVVQLYEKGYGKDAAGIAMEAIAYGRWSQYQLTGMTVFFSSEGRPPFLKCYLWITAICRRRSSLITLDQWCHDPEHQWKVWCSQIFF